MPRESYDHLTDETRETLTDNVKAMACGWDKSTRYVYQILEEERVDFFAPFESMYRGALRAGLPTAEWDRKLAYLREAIKPERRRVRSVTEILAEKVGDEANTMQLLLEAIRDGRIDDRERKGIRQAVAAERKDLDEIDRLLSGEESVH